MVNTSAKPTSILGMNHAEIEAELTKCIDSLKSDKFIHIFLMSCRYLIPHNHSIIAQIKEL